MASHHARDLPPESAYAFRPPTDEEWRKPGSRPSKKKQRRREYGPFGRYYRCEDQAKPGCGAIHMPLDPSSFVCPICGAEGSYRPFIGQEVLEVSWWLEPRLVGYLTREGTYIKLVPVSDVDVTRGILE